MDSDKLAIQEAANLAQIENTRLSRQMLKIMWATLAFGAVSAACAIVAVWPSSEAGGGSMRWIWLPAIILGAGSLVTATALIIVAFKQWRYKKLAKLTAQLQSDLTQAKSDLETERAIPKLVEDTSKITKLTETLEAAKESANKLQSDNYVLEDELKISKAKVAELEESVNKHGIALNLTKIDQGKLVDANSSLVSKIAGLEQQLSQAEREAEQAKVRANSEAIHQANATNRVNELERDQAIWEPVLKQARNQAAQIDEWVKMKTAIPGKLFLRKRIVTLEIRIHNNSLFPISIRPKDVKGSLVFKAERLKEEIDMVVDDPTIWPLEPGGTALIKLHQPLRIFEAEKVQEAREGADEDALFWLGDLYIPISAKDTPVPVPALPLLINSDCISLDVHSFRSG